MGKTIARRIVAIMGIVLVLFGIFVFYQTTSPEIAYQLKPPDVQELTFSAETTEDLSVNRLIIPAIGVDMQIGSEKRFLDFGGWVQSSNQVNEPNLIAIHRYGWDNLSPEQKIKQTLYHVQKLKGGDKIYLIWNGKRYQYEVTNLIDDTNNPPITDDLILYTCKFFNSSHRIFVQTKRV
jgi:sortase (surface protein transpeptidase)